MVEFIRALNKCQLQANLVLKNKSVSAGARKYNYADLASVFEYFAEVFAPEGFAVTQCVNDGFIVTTLFHTSGEFVSSQTPLYNDNQQNRSQGLGSAITYARRYALCAICGIVADEDDDGELTAKAEHKKQNIIDEWFQRVKEVQTPQDCNDILREIKAAPEYVQVQVKGFLNKHIQSVGIIYTKESGFVYGGQQ